MKTMRPRTLLLVGLVACMLLADALVALQADAVLGTRRRTRRRTAIVTAAVVSSQQKEEAAKKEAAEDAEEAEKPSEGQKQDTAAAQPAPAPDAGAPGAPGAAKPIGTIVHTLPAGCQQTNVGGVAYQKCGADYYRAAFQGSELVYVTAQP